MFLDIKILRNTVKNSLTADLSYDEKPGIQAIRNIFILTERQSRIIDTYPGIMTI